MRPLIELMAFPEDLMAPFNLIFNPSMVTQGLKIFGSLGQTTAKLDTACGALKQK